MRFSEPMDGVVFLRVSRDEKRSLEEATRKRGITLSQLFRNGAHSLARKFVA